jgi:hypothetical protein
MASVTGTTAGLGHGRYLRGHDEHHTNGQWLCTILPSGTTTDTKSCLTQVTKDYPYYHAVTSLISGTGATVSVAAVVGAVGTAQQEFRTSAVVTGDTQIKPGPGFVDIMTCIGTDVAATAGTIILYDSLTEANTIVVSWAPQVLNYSTPVIFPVRRAFTTGIYLGYTTLSDIACYMSYR